MSGLRTWPEAVLPVSPVDKHAGDDRVITFRGIDRRCCKLSHTIEGSRVSMASQRYQAGYCAPRKTRGELLPNQRKLDILRVQRRNKATFL